MIKAEVMVVDGVTQVIFETNNLNDTDALDKINQALMGPYPRRSVYESSTRLVVLAKVPKEGNQ